jgi:hypothetical protein
MPNTPTLIAQAYSAFNHRDIDSALLLMNRDSSRAILASAGLLTSPRPRQQPRGKCCTFSATDSGRVSR